LRYLLLLILIAGCASTPKHRERWYRVNCDTRTIGYTWWGEEELLDNLMTVGFTCKNNNVEIILETNDRQIYNLKKMEEELWESNEDL